MPQIQNSKGKPFTDAFIRAREFGLQIRKPAYRGARAPVPEPLPSPMKPLQWRRGRAGPWLSKLPRLKHMRGTWLHRTFGERLFGKEIWQPQRERFAAGAAVGMFFAMMPLPFQMLASGLIAVLTRVSLPAAVVCTWISNPLTIPLFLYLQFKVGSFLLGKVGVEPPHGGILELLSSAPLPLLVGALACGVVFAIAAYPISLVLWDVIEPRLHKTKPRG